MTLYCRGGLPKYQREDAARSRRSIATSPADQWQPPGRDPQWAMTLEEIAEVLGVTRERVRQIEGAALKKLRHPKNSKTLKEFV